MLDYNEYILMSKFEKFDTEMTKCLRQFPRFERYCLAKDIRNTSGKIFRCIISLNKRYFKKTTLTELDVELGYLKYLMRKSYRFGYLNVEKYNILIDYLIQEGKMVGSWINRVLLEEAKDNPKNKVKKK